MLTLAEVATDPYLVEGAVVTVNEHPTEGQIRQIGLPVRFSASRWPLAGSARPPASTPLKCSPNWAITPNRLSRSPPERKKG